MALAAGNEGARKIRSAAVLLTRTICLYARTCVCVRMGVRSRSGKTAEVALIAIKLAKILYVLDHGDVDSCINFLNLSLFHVFVREADV